MMESCNSLVSHLKGLVCLYLEGGHYTSDVASACLNVIGFIILEI